jgi:hypothetical protein
MLDTYIRTPAISLSKKLLLRYYTFNDFDAHILSASFPMYVENNKDRKPAMAILISHIATLQRKKGLLIVKVGVKEKGNVEDIKPLLQVNLIRCKHLLLI